MPIMITAEAPMLSAWGSLRPSARPARPLRLMGVKGAQQLTCRPPPSVGRAEIRNDHPSPFTYNTTSKSSEMLGNPIQDWQRITCSAANSLAPTLTIS